MIAITANVLEHDHHRYRASGIDDVLCKPVEPSMLYATVARLTPSVRRNNGNGAAPAPAAAAVTHPPIFDIESALGFLGGNRELLVRTARMFIASNEHDVEQILALITAADLKTASRRFHRLKGSSAMLGCRRLTELSAQLERELKAPEAKAPPAERLREFSEVMGQTMMVLRKHVEAQGA